jgi:hypothetical protein
MDTDVKIALYAICFALGFAAGATGFFGYL